MKELIQIHEWLKQFDSLSVKPTFEDIKKKVESMLPYKHITTDKAKELYFLILKEHNLYHHRNTRKVDVILIKQCFVKILYEMGYKQKEIIGIFNYKDRSIIGACIEAINGLLETKDEKAEYYYKKVVNLVNEAA